MGRKEGTLQQAKHYPQEKDGYVGEQNRNGVRGLEGEAYSEPGRKWLQVLEGVRADVTCFSSSAFGELPRSCRVGGGVEVIYLRASGFLLSPPLKTTAVCCLWVLQYICVSAAAADAGALQEKGNYVGLEEF